MKTDPTTLQYPEDSAAVRAAAVGELWKCKEVARMCPDRKLVIQAGGNVGAFALEFLALGFEKVLTFEPDKKNYECLIQNTKGRDGISSWNMALGDKITWCEVYGPTSNRGALKVREASRDQPGVVMVPIDSFGLQACDLIYLDVEGAEHIALMGAKRTIEQFRPIIALENKGLIPGFGGTIDGSPEFKDWVCRTFGYAFHTRWMRDDVFVPDRWLTP